MKYQIYYKNYLGQWIADKTANNRESLTGRVTLLAKTKAENGKVSIQRVDGNVKRQGMRVK